MQTYQDFTQWIESLFRPVSDLFQSFGIPFGPIAWFQIIVSSIFLMIIIVLYVKIRRMKKSSHVYIPDEATTGFIASEADFIENIEEAQFLLGIEEHGLKSIINILSEGVKKGHVDGEKYTKIVDMYKARFEVLKESIDKSVKIKELITAGNEAAEARDGYLQKLRAMSGTTVETTDETSDIDTTPINIQDSTIDEPKSDDIPGGGPPGGGPPGASVPSGDPPGGTSLPRKSSLQSEMLAEIERLRTLMEG